MKQWKRLCHNLRREGALVGNYITICTVCSPRPMCIPFHSFSYYYSFLFSIFALGTPNQTLFDCDLACASVRCSETPIVQLLPPQSLKFRHHFICTLHMAHTTLHRYSEHLWAFGCISLCFKLRAHADVLCHGSFACHSSAHARYIVNL